MDAALRALLDESIDYAGLFPPARLPMKEAVDAYLSYLRGPERWIVSRFVCSAGRLNELLVELMQHDPADFAGIMPLPVAVVGSISPDHKHFGIGLEHDAKEMDKFQRSAEHRADIDAFEVRLPDHDHVEEYVRDLRAFDHVDLFAELPWHAKMGDSLAILAESDYCGAKARTGGLEAAAFPSVVDLGSFIQGCVHLDLPHKFTAGLHHAAPFLDPETGARMHGFLNVFAAVALTAQHDLNLREIESILLEPAAEAFVFEGGTLTWGDLKATSRDIAEARELVVSFGSCSVVEPLEGLDLAKLLAGQPS